MTKREFGFNWKTKRKRYENMDGVKLNNSFSQLRKWQKERRAKRKDLSYQIPQASPDLDYLHRNRKEMSITWIGHATFLIQMGGLNIITDPVWANRMGFAKRLAPPGLDISQLPDIDVVLISHGHYDHLDFPTLRRLPGAPAIYVPAGLRNKLRRKGYREVEELSWWQDISRDGVTFTFVPAQHWTRRTLMDTNTSHWGGWVISARGTDRGKTASVGREASPVVGEACAQGRESSLGVEEACAKSREESPVVGGACAQGRKSSLGVEKAFAQGRESSLGVEEACVQGRESSLGVEEACAKSREESPVAGKAATLGRTSPQVVYFAGDSGYFRGFREIGRRFNIDYALLPIGAYEPEWFMSTQHVTPEEAVQALEDCGGQVMVPMHYGAFRLADDTPKEALDRLHAEWQRRALPPERLRCLRHGETLRSR
ncbi:MBL fold metallo-hydrolase [Paenibacillus sp. SAFN-117]|uniref:MBL fold metallo-hydrolase n=1 Tax=Paenibacillus sp. SAFN-117 TaxID=3436860 RepID=UPI003F7CE9F1